MASPTQYDLLLDGIKIGGAAQRKTKDGFVHQASLFLCSPPWEKMRNCLQNGTLLVEAMQAASSSLQVDEKEMVAFRNKFTSALIKCFRYQFVND